MNRVFLVMVVSALLVTFGFAQTPDAGSNTDPANVKGCLGGSDGNYTVVEDGTRQTFKITTSSVDLKPHLGHDVKLIGHKAGATASPGAADNSFAVTELSMISEHCAAAAAAAPAATVIPPAETVIAPDPAPLAPPCTPADYQRASALRRPLLHRPRLPARPRWTLLHRLRRSLLLPRWPARLPWKLLRRLQLLPRRQRLLPRLRWKLPRPPRRSNRLRPRLRPPWKPRRRLRTMLTRRDCQPMLANSQPQKLQPLLNPRSR